MVRTRSQASEHEDEHDEHVATQEPTPRATNPAHPVQIRFMESSPSTSAGLRQESIIDTRRAFEEHSLHARPPSPPRSTRSQRSTASTTARMKQAEYEAAERLAAIQMRQLRQQQLIEQQQLEVEAELVRKKLEADLAAIQDDDQGSTRGPEEAINMNLRTEDWLRHADLTRGEPPTVRLPARETRTPPAAAPPVRPGTNITEPRSEHHYEYCRARSPTSNRSRNRSIEALVECFNRMSQYRPPPRSSTELPTFSGSENEWLPFKASMRDSTWLHKFSPIENMQRLRNALKGEARDAVASLLYTACDPTEVMEALEQSFGRPEALIDKALDEIKLLPPLGPTTTELNVFAVKVKNIVATITNVEGLDGCLQNRMLTRDIVEKLPPDLRRSFARYASENRRPKEPHIVILSRFLNNEAAIGLEFTYSKPPAPITLNQKEPHPRSARTASTTWKNYDANVFSANEEEQCQCCGGDHEPPQCKKMRDMTVTARWDWAKANKVCFKCLTKNHLRTECKAKQCGVDGCIHSHHPLLHERSPSSEASHTNHDASQEQMEEVVASTSTNTKTGCNVMLKVCPVVLKNSDGVEIHTYALLDEGSTITLIEEDLADQLNLKGPANAVNIRGINSTETEQSSRTVQLQLRGKNTRASHVIRARTVQRFHLLHQTIPLELLRYEHLQALNPSEVCYERARPRLLIGSDNWELIVTKQLLTGERHEPAASRTELGWVIHGTAPRATISNGEEHVLHLSTNDSTEPVRCEHLGALVDPSKSAYDPIQKEDERATTNLVEETAELRLPRYSNTRGVRSHEHASHKVRAPAYAEIIPPRTNATTRKNATRNRLLCWSRRSTRSTAGRIHRNPCDPIKHADHAGEELVENCKPASTQRKPQDGDPVVHSDANVNICTATGRNQRRIFHRSKRKLAVLTKKKKQCKSYAEGRNVADRSFEPRAAPAMTDADWSAADTPVLRYAFTTRDRLVSRSA